MAMQLGTDWLESPDVARVHAALKAKGFRLFLVGGYVRDTIIGREPRDMDFATDARPDDVIAVGGDLGFDLLLHGRQFGTVILVTDTFKHIEITSFRKDIRTDGRHADVVFTTDMTLDAHRRDFTINTLYLDDRGFVHDPTGCGQRDLEARSVQFVGRAETRIHEDSLRVLRFFRMNARLSVQPGDYDGAAIQAIRNCDKVRLMALSDFRVSGEMLHMMQIPDPRPALQAMRETAVLELLFPEIDFLCLMRLIDMQLEWEGPSPELARLYLLGPPAPPGRLRPPRRIGLSLRAIADALSHPHPLESAIYYFGSDTAIAVAHLQAALKNTHPPPDLLKRLEAGRTARFPLTSADVLPRVDTTDIGSTLRALEEAWIASGYTLTKTDLLRSLDRPETHQT
ncbi:MAG: CCA tRNA nucleotidyltransferase [Rhodobacteraceae bacterium]|nr:CCA tRNA nucleotidyltransferase [Paracoccaceae bacterium]